ncbi:response regulator [Sphingomonas psychrotolerans]|nr:response regulator transcription factor [Sphingomonas psychrotolerans]
MRTGAAAPLSSEVRMARIIIADDDELVGEMARDALIAAGHGAGLVSNGADALKIIKARRPDLVILDCNMPELSGVLLVEELRRMPEYADLPVLMLTGRRSDRDEELARFAGANDYMKKPFDPDELVFRVEELLAAKR